MSTTRLRTSLPDLRLIAFFAIVAGAAFSAWFLVLRDPREIAQGRQAMSVAPLDFGEVWAQDALECRVDFANRTADTIEVLDFQTSCRCIRAEPSAFVLPPAGQTRATLTMDLTETDPTQSIREPRQMSVSVLPIIKGRAVGDDRFTITGRVKNPLAFSVPKVEFRDDDYLPTENKYLVRKVAFESAVPLRSATAYAEPPHVDVRAELESETRGVLWMLPNVDLPVDRLDCRVCVALQSTGGESLRSPALPVNGGLIRSVELIPPAASLTPGRLGETRRTTVVFRSRRGDPVSVVSVEPASKETTVQAATHCEIPGALAYNVSHHIMELGAHTTTVDFVLAAGAVKSQRVRFRVSYVGLP